jgi:type VI secretion system secreted protein Hcp
MKQHKLTFLTPAAWLICLLLSLASFHASAALDGYMRATGETQGDIHGSVDQAGREDTMEVIEFTHNVSQLIDSASGLPAGKKQHRPIRIIKPVDKASPILMNVLVNNENLTTVRIDFWKPSSAGKEFQYYTVELVNAKITSISQFNSSDEEFVALRARETISLVYDRIIWTWQDGGITAEDVWTTPVP